MSTTTTIIIHRVVKTAVVPALFVLAAAGCDGMVEQASDPEQDGYHEEQVEAGEEEIDSFWGDELPEDAEAPASSDRLVQGGASEGPEAVVFFRLMSKQRRTATDEALCFEPLDNVSGAPVLQKACTTNPLGDSNRQAWFKSVAQGHRMQYAFKDKLSGSDLCLHMTGGTRAISDGVAAVLFQCDGIRPNQVLRASPADADGAIALMAEHSHRCLTVFGGLDSEQALLYQFGLYTGAASCPGVHQRWYLKTDQGSDFAWTLLAPEGWTAPPCVL
jgi:hypothetical protein